MNHSKYASKKFWVNTFDRAVASLAQGLISAGALETTGVLDVDWTGVLSLAGSYTLLSVLTSVAFRGNKEGKTDGERAGVRAGDGS